MDDGCYVVITRLVDGQWQRAEEVRSGAGMANVVQVYEEVWDDLVVGSFSVTEIVDGKRAALYARARKDADL